jgi:hypothetical protein
MVGRPSPPTSSISQLTSQPETIPSCYRRSRHTKFQPNLGRHLKRFAAALEARGCTPSRRNYGRGFEGLKLKPTLVS